MTGTCPVTGGLPTRMSRSSFATVCEAKRIAANEAAEKNSSGWQWSRCLECGGNDIPPELSFMEDIMAAKKYIQGTCEVCEKMANITKSNGKFVCSTCEHIVRAVRNRPDIVRRLMRDTYGDATEITEANIAMERTLYAIKEALGVLDDTPFDDLPEMVRVAVRDRAEYAAEINNALDILEYNPDESLADVAGRRMSALRKLGESHARSCEYAEHLEETINTLRGKLESSSTCTLEVKQYPADHLPITRLLADKNLLAAINTLADALEEV